MRILAQVAVVATNLFFASLPFLQLFFLWLLFSPISVFYNAVRDVASESSEPREDTSQG